MSRIEYEFEISCAASVATAQGYLVRYRLRDISKMVARRIEMDRRKVYVSDVDATGTTWRFSDTDERLSPEQTLEINVLLGSYLKEKRHEGHFDKAAVGLPSGKWYKDGRKS